MQTRISGTLEDIRTGDDLAVVPCGKRSVELPEGEHRIRVVNPDGFAMSSLVLSPSAPVAEARPDRPAVLAWSPTHREVEVSVSSESVVGVAESANPGWSATLDGTELRPVVLDGWRQGFVLPGRTPRASSPWTTSRRRRSGWR